MHCERGKLQKKQIFQRKLSTVGEERLFYEGGGASASTLILFVLSLMTQRLNGPYRELISSSLQLGSLKSIWMFYGFLKDI